MKSYLTRTVRATLGLVLFSFGVYLTIQANIGLAPWDCLCVGVTRHIPVSYGTVSICVSILILAVDLLMGERIGLGTLIDAVICGACVDLFTSLGLVPLMNSLWLGLLVMLLGLTLMALGQYAYMSAALGCGPRDTLLVALGKRMRGLPIGAVNILILLVVLLGGALLGGPVGAGTIFSAFGVGAVVQIVCRLLRFEPRDVRHEDLIGTVRALAHTR